MSDKISAEEAAKVMIAEFREAITELQKLSDNTGFVWYEPETMLALKIVAESPQILGVRHASIYPNDRAAHEALPRFVYNGRGNRFYVYSVKSAAEESIANLLELISTLENKKF